MKIVDETSAVDGVDATCDALGVCQDTLDHLHILLNYNWDSRALLSIVLVGLPELRDRLALRRNRSLYSRLHHRVEIDPLRRSRPRDHPVFAHRLTVEALTALRAEEAAMLAAATQSSE